MSILLCIYFLACENTKKNSLNRKISCTFAEKIINNWFRDINLYDSVIAVILFNVRCSIRLK